MTRKGQITLESLLLYGVAILVVLLAVGALTYFGILDLGRLLPDRCNLGSAGTLGCDEWRVDATNDEIQLGLRNVGAATVDVASVSFYPDGAVRGEATQTCVFDDSSPPDAAKDTQGTNIVYTADRGVRVASGSIVAFTLDCGAQAISQNAGQKIRGDIEIEYKESSGAIDQSIGGQLIATVS